MFTFTPNLPDYTLGKFTGLLPFKLFALVKEGRLAPRDENGEPIPPPDLVYKAKRLEEIANNLKELRLVFKGEKQVRFPDHWNVKTRQDARGKVIRYMEQLLNEGATLKQELDARMEDKYSWANYNLPGDPKQRQQVFDLLANATYLIKDIVAAKVLIEENILVNNTIHSEQSETAEIKKIETVENKKQEPKVSMVGEIEKVERELEEIFTLSVEKQPVPEKENNGNFFIREMGDYWKLGFDGKKCTLAHLDGFFYIAALIKNPRTSLSDRELYQITSGTAPDNTISEGTAIEQGLSIGSSTQAINFRNQTKLCQDKYEELQEKYLSAEMEEREEIEEQMKALEPYLKIKARNFADPDAKKIQVNVTKRLNSAYDRIDKVGMKALAEHLRKNIKTDGVYGRVYSGSIIWETKIS